MKFVSRFGAVAALSVAVSALPAQTAAVSPSSGLTSAQEARLMKLGHTYTRWLLTNQLDSLAEGFDPAALEKMGGIGVIRDQTAQLATRAGSETDVVVEKMNRRHGLPQFWHEGHFSEMPDDAFVIRWLFDLDTGKIVGAGMGPKNSTPAPDN